MKNGTIKAPFPYFGGKSTIADRVWAAFGDPLNYVEPFCGSLAMLLGRPYEARTETVNDKDGMIANFWRAIQAEPEQVARWADWPVNENDLHARHIWLVREKENLQTRLDGDPDFFDAKVAGWWVWGMACWVGSGFCSGDGPWQSHNGKLVKREATGQGVQRKIPHLGDAGRGVQRHGNASAVSLIKYFSALACRLRRVRVCCGDWTRVCGPSVTWKHGLTAVFLDPPYIQADRAKVYTNESATAAQAAAAWAIEEGKNPLMRIVYCGYDGGPEFPPDWRVEAWKAYGGIANLGNGRGRENALRERIWYSPACLDPNPEFALEF